MIKIKQDPCAIGDMQNVSLIAGASMGDGIKFSALTSSVSRSSGVDMKRARYIVRCALDSGYIRTDKNFLAHAGDPK